MFNLIFVDYLSSKISCIMICAMLKKQYLLGHVYMYLIP